MVLKRMFSVMAAFENGEVIGQLNDEIPLNTPLAECIDLLIQSFTDNGYGEGEGSYIMLSVEKYWTLFGRKISPSKEVFFFID